MEMEKRHSPIIMIEKETIELIWHYTHGQYLEKILESGELRVSEAESKLKVKPPALWLSKNPIWENTATKDVKTPEGVRRMTKKEMHEKCGLFRFALEFDKIAFITWAKYRYKTNTSIEEYMKMESEGIRWGANPNEWFATFKNIPLAKCLAIEQWDGAEWKNLDLFQS